MARNKVPNPSQHDVALPAGAEGAGKISETPLIAASASRATRDGLRLDAGAAVGGSD